jgi:hypothetical protein
MHPLVGVVSFFHPLLFCGLYFHPDICIQNTYTLCLCLSVCLWFCQIVHRICSHKVMMISLERFSLFSTHLQGATLSFSLKMWAMGSGSVQHCINSLCVNILLIGPYPQPSVQAEQRALILCHCPLLLTAHTNLHTALALSSFLTITMRCSPLLSILLTL